MTKVKAITASLLTLIAFLCIGYQEIGATALLKAVSYAIIIAAPIMGISFKYKKQLLNAPKYLVPLGMLIGIVAFRTLSRGHKPALVCFAIIIGIVMTFYSLIYTDAELKQH